MHGGVSELCSDNFQNDLGPNPVIDPKGNRELRDSGIGVMRGGSSPIRLDRYGKPNTNFFRSAHREPPISGGKIGIRLVVPYEFFSGEEEVKPKYSIGDDKFEMVLISAGKFIMGSPKDEEGRRDGDEETQHEVTLTKSFYMGKYEVTVEQWVAVMGKDPSKFEGEKMPITDVSWNDCQEFIKKLNTTTKGGYRLPTEAEWEYSCRAGTTTAYSFGDKITSMDANYDGSNIKKPEDIGSYKPNAFGLYDMHGNVSEWCNDMHMPFTSTALTDPMTKDSRKAHRYIYRGGSWNGFGREVRSADRKHMEMNYHHTTLGFRLAKDK
jgi:formylglycine-generating enzyme required for sulfatase activity